MFLPVRRATNSLAFLCRRTERAPCVSTDLTRFPLISRSRSRRTTSTSGNSGICVLFFMRAAALWVGWQDPGLFVGVVIGGVHGAEPEPRVLQIGRASCRERV